MAVELGFLPVAQRSYSAAYDIWRALNIFRKVREGLRHAWAADVCLAQWQYIAAAQRLGWEPAALERLVTEWLYQRPLKYLRFCRRCGLETFCASLENKGIRLGVFSDYPVLDKLKRLGVAERMSVTLCATDPEVDAFKPYPKGFLHACTLWGLRPEEVLYVGDRPEVDAVGARNAGMPCVILAHRARREGQGDAPSTYTTVTSFARLQRALLRGNVS